MEPFEARERISQELFNDETLLWSGVPKQGLMLKPSDAVFVPFSIIWGGFAIFWEASVVTTGAGLFFDLWGIPFVAVGLYMMVGRFFADSYERKRTAYGVTSRRVIVVRGIFRDQVRSFTLRSLPELSLHPQRDGRGTITLGESPMFTGRRGYQPPALEGIENARDVYQIVLNAQAGAK